MDYLIINNEKCYQIKGFERYHISESCRIYRTDIDKKRSWRTEGKVFISENKIHFRIKNNKLSQGLASLTDKKGKLHNVCVAPLVALAFGVISKKLNKRQDIGYKDGNKRNLHYSNLILIDKKNPSIKLTLKDVKQIKKLIRKDIDLIRLKRNYFVLLSYNSNTLNKLKSIKYYIL